MPLQRTDLKYNGVRMYANDDTRYMATAHSSFASRRLLLNAQTGVPLRMQLAELLSFQLDSPQASHRS